MIGWISGGGPLGQLVAVALLTCANRPDYRNVNSNLR
jgi:hypothetical protein